MYKSNALHHLHAFAIFLIFRMHHLKNGVLLTSLYGVVVSRYRMPSGLFTAGTTAWFYP